MEFIKKIFNPIFYLILAGLILFELSSYFGFVFFNIDHWLFIFVVILTLILSVINIKYGVWIVLLELFIGSKGYLLHLDVDSVKISLRLGLWLVVLAAWTGYFLFSLRKKENRSIFLSGRILKTANFPYFILLFFFILWGVVGGFMNNNSFENIFFDANGWLFFALIFPFFEAFFNPALSGENPLLPIMRIFTAASAWLCFKTFLLLFFFTHGFAEIGALPAFFYDELYHWVRDTGVGEITQIPGGFVRIFLQSQIFVLSAFFFWLAFTNHFWPEIKKSWKFITGITAAGALLSGTVLASFSRSFWVGAVFVFILYAVVSLKKYGGKNFFSVLAVLTVSLVCSLGLIVATLKFPFPAPNQIALAGALAERAGNLSGEAAISSRSALLPKLTEKIGESPVLGKGFGTLISYKTSDPRILENNPGGNYATYAFEWGWLDIWLKIGIFGILAYLLLIGKITAAGLKKNTWLALGFSSGLLLITIVSIFSPYTNHPLGIGFLLLAAAAIERERQDPCAGE
jgi:hypothetical protein